MRTAELTIYRDEKPLFGCIRHARRFLQRLVGLLFSAPLEAGQGLLIAPCNQVHTLGMRFPIDVLFLDAEGVILKCVPQLKPFRLAGARKAKYTLELAAGSIAAYTLAPGQQLHWQVGVTR